MEARDDSGMAQKVKSSDANYIESETTGFADGLDIGSRRKVCGDTKVLGLSHWKGGVLTR